MSMIKRMIDEKMEARQINKDLCKKCGRINDNFIIEADTCQECFGDALFADYWRTNEQ